MQTFEPGRGGYTVWSVFNVDVPCYYGIDGTIDGEKTVRLGGGVVTGSGWQTCATLMDWEGTGGPGELLAELTATPIEGQPASPVQFQNFRMLIMDAPG
jgi:hypothetical protein